MSTAPAKHPIPSAADAHEAMLNALSYPVLSIAPNGYIVEANAAAEAFFESGLQVLRRHTLQEFVPFGSPVISLIDQVRSTGVPVNEYRVDLGTPRNGNERMADIHVTPLPEREGHVVVVLQERNIASKIDRQLTHRGAARSVTALAAMLAHEIKNPLSGIRGAAQLLEHSASDQDRHGAITLFCDNLRAYLAGEPLRNVIDWERGY